MAQQGEKEKDWDLLAKLLVQGDVGVGKSSLLSRYFDDEFSEQFMPTIGVDFKMANKDICSKKVKLQMWDVAGAERFRAITSTYYRGAHVVMLCYDITDHDSFEHLERLWLPEVRKFGSEGLIISLVGCKSDLSEHRRQVSTEEAQDFALKNHIDVFREVSSKSGEGVATVIEESAAQFTTRIAGSIAPRGGPGGVKLPGSSEIKERKSTVQGKKCVVS